MMVMGKVAVRRQTQAILFRADQISSQRPRFHAACYLHTCDEEETLPATNYTIPPRIVNRIVERSKSVHANA